MKHKTVSLFFVLQQKFRNTIPFFYDNKTLLDFYRVYFSNLLDKTHFDRNEISFNVNLSEFRFQRHRWSDPDRSRRESCPHWCRWKRRPSGPRTIRRRRPWRCWRTTPEQPSTGRRDRQSRSGFPKLGSRGRSRPWLRPRSSKGRS